MINKQFSFPDYFFTDHTHLFSTTFGNFLIYYKMIHFNFHFDYKTRCEIIVREKISKKNKFNRNEKFYNVRFSILSKICIYGIMKMSTLFEIIFRTINAILKCYEHAFELFCFKRLRH